MKHTRIAQSLFLAATLMLAFCQKANDKNPALFGTWQGTEWLIMDKPSDIDASKVSFEFKEDGTYSAQFAEQKQSGTWRTEKDKLYTQETGKQEIMVKFGIQEPQSKPSLTKEEIQKRIAEGKTEALLNLLNQGNPDLIMLKAQFNDGKKQFEMGTIQHDEWSRIQARINFAILEMADSLAGAKSEADGVAMQFEMNRGGQKEILKLAKK